MPTAKVFISSKLIQEYNKRDAELMWGMHDWMRRENVPCAKCKVMKMEHAAFDGPDNHPHFANNLEMLEWLSK